jgi:hypothetical protein
MDVSFPWPDLLPEMRALVRSDLDDPTWRMLALTCKVEVQARPRDHVRIRAKKAFAKAASLGYLDICIWLFDLTCDWRNQEDAAPYREVLFFDKALENEHFHIADWAHSRHLPLKPKCGHTLVIKNCFASLRWMAEHGLALPSWFDARASSLPMIRWLVEERGILPLPFIIADLAFGLPSTRERMDYFAGRGFSLPQDPSLLIVAVRHGLWDTVDFLRKCLPAASYVHLTVTCPLIEDIISQRPLAPPGHCLDPYTGEFKEYSLFDRMEKFFVFGR